MLAGRRGDRRPGYRSPLVGLVLLLAGIGLSVLGTRGDGEILIAAAAVVSVLGMILLVPVVVAVLARFSRTASAGHPVRRTRRRPPPHPHGSRRGRRGRDGGRRRRARHRQRQRRRRVRGDLPAVDALGPGLAERLGAGRRLRALRTGHRSGGAVGDVHARSAPTTPTSDDVYYDIRVHRPGVQRVRQPGDLVRRVLRHRPRRVVEPGPRPGRERGRSRPGRAPCSTAAVWWCSRTDARRQRPDPGQRVDQSFRRRRGHADRPRSSCRRTSSRSAAPRPAWPSPPPGALDATGLTAATAGLALDADGPDRGRGGQPAGGDLRASTRTRPSTSSAATSSDNETLILLGILFGLGAVLMLGGTLTATFLALSDARPDLATLSAVGRCTPDAARRGGGVRPGRRVRGRRARRRRRVHPRHRDHLSADVAERRPRADRPVRRAAAQPLRRRARGRSSSGWSWCCPWSRR